MVNQLECEVADQRGWECPISTVVRKTEPKSGQAKEGGVDCTRVLGPEIQRGDQARDRRS